MSKYTWSMLKCGDGFIEVSEGEYKIKSTFYIPNIKTIKTRAPFNSWQVIINSGQSEEDEEVFYFKDQVETDDFYYHFLYLLTGTITIREDKND